MDALRDQLSDIGDADSRLKELILYIAWCCLDSGNLGATKLNKILFYSDFAAYLQLGTSITGQDYFALSAGPAPKRLLPVRKELEEQKAITVYKTEVAVGYYKQLIVPHRKPDISWLTPEQIAIVDQMMVRFIWRSAKEVSDESHRFIGWIAASQEETIPYNTAFLDAANILGTEPQQISKDAIEHARALEDKAKRLLEEYA